jgi:hypothetical protein
MFVAATKLLLLGAIECLLWTISRLHAQVFAGWMSGPRLLIRRQQRVLIGNDRSDIFLPVVVRGHVIDLARFRAFALSNNEL